MGVRYHSSLLRYLIKILQQYSQKCNIKIIGQKWQVVFLYSFLKLRRHNRGR
nr:MAG TPA: hypothetical protein [Caudoviricetes sp.]